ncbi:hypothetical protein LCGC14_1664300 [marine sediment metagenome]|uniref:Uncharacterized protein n=1 Tax=marine sediment metagenome TaxID=412755 RepID=A0A0F9K918_9ZZZZ
MDFDKLSREQLLHIVANTVPELIERELRITWRAQDEMQAQAKSERPVCHDCIDIQHTLGLR